MATTAAPDGTSGGPLPPFMRPNRTFHWGDYVVFAFTLAISAVIGIYYGIKLRKTMSVRELLLGNRNLKVIPVSLSLLATLVSTLFIIGVPAETYYAGEWPIYLVLAFVPATIVTAHVFVPIFHRMGVMSVYEYLGLRFNRTLRWMGAINFTIMMLVSQALTVYTPAIAFSLVAGISMEVSVLAAGLVCTFYTALGGIRAVVVTDIIQMVIILAGVLGLLIYGSINAGGILEVFKVANQGDRLQLWNYSLTSTATFGMWSQVIGGSFLFLSLFASNQSHVQRYCSIKKCRDAQKAVYVSMGLYVLGWVLVLFLGIVIYAFYYACDPLLNAVIYSPDQIVPLFIMDTIGHLHGLPGLFTACVFGAVLSTVSSGINSLAAVSLEDMIRPLHRATTKREISDQAARALVRVLALFFGLVTIGLAYLPVRFGTYLLNIDITFSVFGVFGGPMLGVFIMGAMFPIANSLGATIGLVVGLLFGMWMWVGRILCGTSSGRPAAPPVPASCLDMYNMTSYTGQQPPVMWPAASMFSDCPLQELYDISYLWYGLIGTGVTLVIGTIIGFCSCGDRGNVVDPALLCFGNKCYKNSQKFLHPAATKITPKRTMAKARRFNEQESSKKDNKQDELFHISSIQASTVNPAVMTHHQQVAKGSQVLWAPY